jgi:hypothetical protein
MVKSFFRRLRRGWLLSPFANRLPGLALTWPAGEVFGVVAPAMPRVEARHGAPTPAPATYEMRFMRLHVEGRFEEMWEMLAEDAQRAWGGIQNFTREMPRLDEWLEILDMQVASVTLLDSWTDHLHERTYSNVARLVMRYHVRQQWKEWTFDRQVHLVPAGGEWRTLCYPTRGGVAATR